MAFVLIIQQQHQHVVVVAELKQPEQQLQPESEHNLLKQPHHHHHHADESDPVPDVMVRPHHQKSPYDDITSYASALATKYLHQHSLTKENLVKREIKNGKNTDFISYLSGK